MLNKLKLYFQLKYDDFMWRYGEERVIFARKRLALHQQAMVEGRNSPFTHPEEYDFA